MTDTLALRTGQPRTGPDALAPKWNCRELLLLFAILAVAALLRISAATLIASPIESDYLGYWTIAGNFAGGRGLANLFGQPTAFLSLGYPVLVGSLFAFTGPDIAVVKALNVALGVLAVLLLHLGARVLFGSVTAALWGTALFALYLEAAVYTAYVAKENLMLPLVLAQLALAARVGRSATPGWNPWLFGVATGWLAMTGNAALALMPGLALLVLTSTRSWRRTATYMMTAGLVAALTAAPLMWRNLTVFGGYSLNNNGGFNLYIGNNPTATPYFRRIETTPMGPRWHALRAEAGERGADRTLREMAIRHIIENPGATAALALRKAVAFWEPPLHAGRGHASSMDGVVRLLWLMQYAGICTLCVIGFMHWRSQRRALSSIALLLLGYTAVHMLFYVVYRYRLPIMPVVCLSAGLGAASLQAVLAQPRGAPERLALSSGSGDPGPAAKGSGHVR